MNRRQLLLFAPSFLMFIWAGSNLIKKHQRQQQIASLEEGLRSEQPLAPTPASPSRMPASIPNSFSAPPSALPQPVEKSEPCSDCHLPDLSGKTRDFEKLQDYASLHCAGKALSLCDFVLGGLSLAHEEPAYLEARQMLVLSCENDSLADCEKVAQLEEREGNLEAARDYSEYSCSQGYVASCQHIVLLDIDLNGTKL